MLPVCAILYYATPPTLLLWQMLPVCMQLVVRSSIVLRQMLLVFYTVGCAMLYCATLPCTTVGADAARFYTVSCAILYCAPPPTMHLG